MLGIHLNCHIFYCYHKNLKMQKNRIFFFWGNTSIFPLQHSYIYFLYRHRFFSSFFFFCRLGNLHSFKSLVILIFSLLLTFVSTAFCNYASSLKSILDSLTCIFSISSTLNVTLNDSFYYLISQAHNDLNP